MKWEDKKKKRKKAQQRGKKNHFHFIYFLNVTTTDSFLSTQDVLSSVINDWGKTKQNKTKLKADMVTFLLLIILIDIKYIKIGSQSVHYNILSGTKIVFHLKMFANTDLA